MKIKKIAALALLALGFAASQAYAAAPTTTGEVDFTGTINTSTCSIATTPVAVRLNTFSSANTTTTGTAYDPQPFHISVSGCETGANVGVAFEQGASTDNATNNQLLNTGTATGVEIGLFNGTDTSSAVQWGQSSAFVAAAAGAATLNFTAAYVPTADTIGAGNVTSTVKFDLTYN